MASSNPQTNEGSSPSPSILSSINTAVNISVYTTQNLIAINVSYQTPIKLTQHNFSTWRLQFYTLLVGYDLLGYVNGILPCPPTTLTSKNGTATPNPAYTHWIRQNHLLLYNPFHFCLLSNYFNIVNIFILIKYYIIFNGNLEALSPFNVTT